MKYLEYKPVQLLQAYIECYWYAEADKPPFQDQEALIPDGTIELMFNFGDHYWQSIDGALKPITGSHIIGIRKQALFIQQSSRQHFFSVRFKTGGTYPFFSIPAHEFSNDFFTVEELLGRAYLDLEDQLYHAPTNLVRVQLLDQFFLQRLTDQAKAFQTARHFMVAADNLTYPSTAEIRKDMCLGYKKLERHFKTATGLTPRDYLKIRRFNKAVKLIYSGRFRSLTEVGLEAGYYDQAHFIRDFKALTSRTPRAFLAEQFKIVEVIQPALAERLSKSYNL